MRSRTLSPRARSSADVGADGVDDHFGALRHFDGFFAGDVAHVVVTVAEQDDRAANRPIPFPVQQLVAAGKIQRVIHRRAAARPQGANSARERFGVVGEILGDFRSDIETHDERFVIPRPDRLVQKLDGRFLLELEAVAHRVAGIDQQSDLQRQLGLVVKAANLVGWPAVVDDREIALGQVLHVVAMPIGHGEDDVHFVHCLGNRGSGIVRCSRILIGLVPEQGDAGAGVLLAGDSG